VREGLLRALIEAQDALAGAGVALDAALGTVQYVEDGEQLIPIPGAPADSGAAFSVITSQLDANGRARVRAGNSWVQVVSWDAAGKPRAQAMLAHGQSDDPGSPHRTELTRQYSAGTWLDLPFTEAAIEAAGVERQLHLMDVRE
jgi:acyl-homoserine-lactone acylase